VQGALNAIQIADGLFASLRERLSALLPSTEIGADECLFTYQDQFDILKVISLGNVTLDSLNSRKRVTGYCFDATAGAAIRVEFLQIRGNISALVAVSPFNNPTQFLGVGRSSPGQALLTVGPILIPQNGRYLLIISDTETNRTERLQGDYAVLLTNIAGQTIINPGLGLDPNTGQVVVNPPVTPQPGLISTPSVFGTPTASSFATCPGLSLVCADFTSCEQALACQQAGQFLLDSDRDGIPCDGVICVQNGATADSRGR
jgi:hypothetical protein